MISIINSGLGNIGSLVNMHEYLNIDYELISSEEQVTNASKIILPGVGSYDEGVKRLKDKGIYDSLYNKCADGKTPILGICLGMQLLLNGSEEGLEPGLGLIDGYCRGFKSKTKNTMHMGWNNILQQENSSLFHGIDFPQRFYFVHAFYADVLDENILTKTTFDIEFTSSIRRDNIYGVQFHPEKSHKFGLNLFKNFNEIE